jgi:hypothetical protein
VLIYRRGGSVRDVGEDSFRRLLVGELGRIGIEPQAYLTAALVDERREPVREGRRASRP